MGKAWFRKSMGIGYVPIAWQGWLVSVLMSLGGMVFGFLFVSLSERQPLVGWLCAGVGALLLLGGHAIVVWKLERDYGG